MIAGGELLMSSEELMAILNVGKTAFLPSMQALAVYLGKRQSAEYVKKCFKNLGEYVSKKPLQVAAGKAVKELLGLLEEQLGDADVSRKELKNLVKEVEAFTLEDGVATAIGCAFESTNGSLDPKLFADSWLKVLPAYELPDEFCWNRFATEFQERIVAIRDESQELRELFDVRATRELVNAATRAAGIPEEFDVAAYMEAAIKRFGKLDLDNLSTEGAAYDNVKLWSVFVQQEVRECAKYMPQLL